MSRLRFDITVSLDGFVAGEDQSVSDPLGVGGMQLHEWAFATQSWRAQHDLEGGEANASAAILEESVAGIGAVVMGRNMFGPGPGPWPAEPWNGWWGDNPPYHVPVFVVTHYPRPPLVCEGGTTFTFVTGGVPAAVALAAAAAGTGDVALAGGANVAQQCLAAGLVDEVQLHVVPLLLGRGSRLFDVGLFDNLAAAGGATRFEQTRVVEADGVAHLRYRVRN